MTMTVTVMLMLGRMILGPLLKLPSKVVKAAIVPFLKAQQAMEAADSVVDEAERALHDASVAAAAADAVQDRAVLALATALSGDGFSRSNPFKAFGAPSPSKVTNQASLVEAKTLTALAAAVVAHPKAGAVSKRAAADAQRAAQAMTDASMQLAKCRVARAAAVSSRDLTTPKQWREALNDLKAVVRYADVVDGTDHYASVFSSVNKAMLAAKKQKNIQPPVPTAPTR
jgi:hypothetical protein